MSKKLTIPELWSDYAHNAMISWDEFSNYFDGLKYGFAIEMYGYIRYKMPHTLDKITGIASRPPQSYRYILRNEFSAEA